MTLRKRSAGDYWVGRIPLGREALPVSRELCVALAIYFVFFNQCLFLAAALVKDLQGEPGLVGTFATCSIIAGLLTMASWHVLLIKSPCRSMVDMALSILAWLGMGAFLMVYSGSVAMDIVISIGAGNTLMMSWLSVSVLQLWLSKKRESASS